MVIMAARQEQREAVLRFKGGLEDLTFNSKPLIDDLTRAAEVSKSQAGEIVEIIESRILQVDRALVKFGWKMSSSSRHLYCVYIDYQVVYAILCIVDMFYMTCDLKGVIYDRRRCSPFDSELYHLDLYCFFCIFYCNNNETIKNVGEQQSTNKE